ncbi:hypothetical protein ABOM_009312 [Aspergillus bombycis]|uniref:Uncharacterized protein n=1 Tax=Aspergillus bombycis TaxID=109264 RepID=A0A1F7ZV96_9EURO|nr:hypothetical protein ABOM_009312 [Aspergillus bombycis]OGM42998.1 hypothetical protein ABOM_009312 [Aspergillus bombycis]
MDAITTSTSLPTLFSFVLENLSQICVPISPQLIPIMAIVAGLERGASYQTYLVPYDDLPPSSGRIEFGGGGWLAQEPQGLQFDFFVPSV